MDNKLQKRLKLILDGYAHKLLSIEDAVTMLHDIFSGSEHNSGISPTTDVKDDPIYNEAVSYVRESGRVSTSALQTKFKVGYGRATRIITQLEDDGIISPPSKDSNSYKTN